MKYDVAVLGGGNAALCAALAARQEGATVLLVERAPREWRGGNSKYTRNLRVAHDGDEVMPGAYSEATFLEDLERVSGGEAFDRELTKMLIARSREAPRWMESLDVQWQAALRGTLQLSSTNRFFLGGGKALVNHYYATATRLGVDVAYDTEVIGFRFSSRRCVGADVRGPDGTTETIEAGAFVVATGGFESDRQWLTEHWGPGAQNFKIRGCVYNDGGPILRLLDHGARAEGPPGIFHGTAVDRRAPDYDGGIVTRVDSIPLGIVVNAKGERFYDEGEDIWPKRYAIWGRLIAEQDGQTAFSIFDSTARGRFIPPLHPPVRADTIGELARLLALDERALNATVETFNAGAAAHSGADYDLAKLDGRETLNVQPKKSNWALPIERAPFYAFPLRPGVTFTYYGLGVDHAARVATTDGGAFDNVFAAGEAMAGNVLKRGYLAGVGMTIGTVFGRIAGEEAGKHVRS